MTNFLTSFFVTCSPVILGGVANMFFVKTKWFKKNAKRLDREKKWVDGKAIFGKNKTDLGFVGMIIFTMIFQIILGICIDKNNLNSYSLFYEIYNNSIKVNTILGLVLGMCYMVFELPNSFIKRRINIEEGKTKKTRLGKIFFVVDQIDSLIGIGILIYAITNASGLMCIGFVLFGGCIHIAINTSLYLTKVRKNI